MESPFLQPGFLLTLGLAIIGFITWLVKLERRNAANETTIARLEKEIEQQDVKSELARKELKQDFEHHRANADIHFNLRVSEQVDKRNEHRFQTIESQLHEINRKLDQLAGRD